MLFSVYNYNKRSYDYYEAPGSSADYGLRGTKYRAPSGAPSGSPAPGGLGLIGFTPEALDVKLPRNAQFAGSGAEARGCIANMNLERTPRVEMQASVDGLSGFALGADTTSDATLDVKVQQQPLSFGHVVFAACVASVVGVLVQRILK